MSGLEKCILPAVSGIGAVSDFLIVTTEKNSYSKSISFSDKALQFSGTSRLTAF